MKRLLTALLLCVSATALGQARDIEIAAPDGVKLKATYYPAQVSGKAVAKVGTSNAAPAVLLLHMCNTTRKSWAPVAEQLSAEGISALTVDYRGFGESGGPRFEGASPETLQKLRQQWPADLDRVFEWMLSQPGVDKSRIGAGGGSCGVDNAVQLARRHPEVRTLVLLAGGTNPDGLKYLTDHAWIPIFTAAARDDEYDSRAPELMEWFARVTGNGRNRFVGFHDGRHGTEIFGPHPELVRYIVAWYRDTLVTSPARAEGFSAKQNPMSEFWALANQPGGGTKAAQMFRDARRRDANAFLFPEPVVNILGYTRLQAGAHDDAIALFKLNTEAYPTSANAQDSLADGYLAAGKNDMALAAEQKCLGLLPADSVNAEFKAQLRQAAEQKIAKMKAK